MAADPGLTAEDNQGRPFYPFVPFPPSSLPQPREALHWHGSSLQTVCRFIFLFLCSLACGTSTNIPPLIPFGEMIPSATHLPAQHVPAEQPAPALGSAPPPLCLKRGACAALLHPSLGSEHTPDTGVEQGLVPQNGTGQNYMS